jgi:hypothetical protein
MGRPIKDDAPGLKRKRNKDGTLRWYWEASSGAVKGGYRPASVRLHYPDTPEGKAQQAARCRVLQQEMLAWLSNDGEFPRQGYDGTMGSLCRLYETHQYSPMQRMKYNAQLNRSKDLKIICKTVGARRISRLIGPDFNQWCDKWSAPAAPDKPRRPWRGKHCIDAVRAAIAFGVTLRLPGCAAVKGILEEMRFNRPPSRTVKMTLAHVQAIVPAAHAMRLGSVALATTLQFECSLRQKDVIGEWWPHADGDGGITSRGKRWGTGLLWSDIDQDWILRKKTSKRGVEVEHDLKLCPLALVELQRVPVERRIGPLIISEATGEPYKSPTFTDTFRRVANRAGVPKHVWNMDSRAGAISEAYAAGASQADVMKLAGHQDARTNAAYNRSSLEQTRRAAALRLRKRDENKV